MSFRLQSLQLVSRLVHALQMGALIFIGAGLLLARSPSADEPHISTHIDGYGEVGAPNSRRACPRPFVGTFDFIKLPAPLQEAEVDFTLTALKESKVGWDVSVWALDSENRVDIVGDSVQVWPGPIKIGDQFSGTIKFVPLVSGVTSLDVGAHMFGGIECGLTITWCLSEDGELLYLGNSELEQRQRIDCYVLSTFYFTEDSVFMTDPPYRRRSGAVGGEVVIKPVPKVGDTSIIAFRLTANRDCPDGWDYYVTAGGMEVVSVPGPLAGPISAGELIELSVGVIPLAANTAGNLDFQIFDDLTGIAGGEYSHEFRTNFIFDEEGALKYATNHGFSSGELTHLPEGYHHLGRGYSGRITVWKSGLVERDGGVVVNTRVGKMEQD